jgi:acetyl-CoA carboxylase carboxyl transferase subunit alpha
LGITSDKLSKLGLIDRIIPEPLGGAHRDFDTVTTSIRDALESSLRELRALNSDQLLEKRYKRLMSFGKFNS